MEYMRDENGDVYGFIYDRATYYLEKNALGDVRYLLDISGNVVAKYTYDEWGKKVSVTDANGNDITDGTNIAHLNPFRYRSYYYDNETGLYYLNSRYYDPCTGRFVNADEYVSTGTGILGFNMFTYCENNPVNRADHTGHFWGELLDNFVQTLQQARSYFAVAAGVSQADSPAPGPADIAAGVLLLGGLLVCGAVALHDTLTAPEPALSLPQPKVDVEEKDKDITVSPQPKNHAYFTIDPNEFNPVGLVRKDRPGTKNGAIISWMDPVANIEVFRWDENPNYPNGAHYHIYGAGHYYAGTAVPEPYATIYFPLM